MSDYSEHLISMAGGDVLAGIKEPYAAERERRAAVAYAIRDTLPTRNAWDMADAAIEAADVPALLAMVREQQARIGELTMLLEEADEKCCCGVCGI